ncbi:MAG: hypothetical protein VKQ33_05155 [Candidatus Sericytochromatia bacterium]|nr:hypothetical protein [Candidatus Sericytochromatia bacterium]
MRAPLVSLLVAATLPGCASLLASRPEAPEAQAERLRREPFSLATIQHEGPTGPTLRLREKGLAEVPLGASTDAVRMRFGAPHQTASTVDGLWWDFDELAPLPVERRQPSPDTPPDEHLEPDAWRNTAHLRVLFHQRADGEGAARVVHLQAWAPARFMTRSLVRPLDPSTRVLRKYGPPVHTRAWGTGELWIYPDADVAFVVTPDHPDQPRVVAGILVGLALPRQPRP